MKKWYLSKTLWVNILSAMVVGCTFFTGVVDSPFLLALAASALAAVNVVLRFVTTSPIASLILHDDIASNVVKFTDVPEGNRHYHVVDLRR